MLELHMAALLGDLEPSIGFEPADDFSAAHVWIIHTVHIGIK